MFFWTDIVENGKFFYNHNNDNEILQAITIIQFHQRKYFFNWAEISRAKYYGIVGEFQAQRNKGEFLQ